MEHLTMAFGGNLYALTIDKTGAPTVVAKGGPITVPEEIYNGSSAFRPPSTVSDARYKSERLSYRNKDSYKSAVASGLSTIGTNTDIPQVRSGKLSLALSKRKAEIRFARIS